MHFPPQDDPLSKKRLFRGADGSLVVGVLPVSIFASGHTFFVSRLHEQQQLEPYVVHATFQFSGTAGKRNRFREFKLWNDPPSYYDTGYAFVTWEMHVPELLLQMAIPRKPTAMCCKAQEGHFSLVNHQLRQLRHGLAVASVRSIPNPWKCPLYGYHRKLWGRTDLAIDSVHI
jgi:arabinosyltransferase